MTIAVDLGLGNPLTQARRFIAGMPYRASTGSGYGYLAGRFPDGITTVEGVPVSATVRILHRPTAGELGDGVVVAEVQSAPDGSWQVAGLNPDLRYDVVGRKEGFNDVIMANVKPYRSPKFLIDELRIPIGVPFDAVLPIIGGEGDVSVTLSSGELPDGISLVGNRLQGGWPTGNVGGYDLIFELADDAGTYQAPLTLQLYLLPLELTPEAIPLSVGEPVDLVFAASGGEAPYAFTISSGLLPPGLAFDGGTASLTGTPSGPDNTPYSFAIEVEDARGATSMVEFSGVVRMPRL